MAELACKKSWWAVKNLIRRQVIGLGEYAEKFCGKTAEEWARYYKEELIAQEIDYYVSASLILLFDSYHGR